MAQENLAPGDFAELSTDATRAAPNPEPVPKRRVWRLLLSAGIVAAVAAGICGEPLAHWHKPRRVTVTVPMTRGPSEQVTAATEAEAAVKNGAIQNAIIGAILGMAMGFAGGLARRSAKAGVLASLAGLLLGGGVAYAASIRLLARFPVEQNVEDLLFPILIHGTIWACVGIIGGTMFGAGCGGRATIAKAAFGGLVGGVLGAVIYDLVGALVFPLGGTASPIAISMGSRLLAPWAVCIASAVCTAIALQVSVPPRPA